MPPCRRAAAPVLALAIAACDWGVDAEPKPPVLVFQPAALALGPAREATITLRNVGAGPASNVVIVATAAGDSSGGATVSVMPSIVALLMPDATVSLLLTVEPPPDGLAAGSYVVPLDAQIGGVPAATLEVRFDEAGPAVGWVTITSGPQAVMQGDVHPFIAEVRDEQDALIAGAGLRWRVEPASGGLVTPDGRFVAYAPGDVRLIAASGGKSDTAALGVSARGRAGSFTVVGHGAVAARFTSDLWVHAGAAYTGTWGQRTTGGGALAGNTLYVWDVRDPEPVLTDSVVVDARTVNDVKVRVADGALAVLTHEGSADFLNGITLLDLTDPFHPATIARHTDSLEGGVHNVWIEGDYVYAAAGRLQVVDVSDPAVPRTVAYSDAPPSFLHDVYVRDGLAFLSHWNAGLVILDVGGVVAGGSPASPVEVAVLAALGGETHNAWYWPAAGYVFVGEEDFGSPPGMLHVVDVSDVANPREVATYRVPGSGPPHNFWVDEAAGILYAAWYAGGLRAVDVSGELLGELDRQGRELGFSQYGGSGACPGSSSTATCTWAPQLHDGLVFVSDMNTGLWVLRFDLGAAPAAGH